MIGAVLIDNIVQNVIVMDESQIEEMSNALGAEIVDARPYGIGIGDVRQGDGSERNPYTWVRNAGGDNLILQPMEEEHYDSWAVLMRRTLEAEAALDAVASRLDEQDVALVELAALIAGGE